jgi:hypothetical protein
LKSSKYFDIYLTPFLVAFPGSSLLVNDLLLHQTVNLLLGYTTELTQDVLVMLTQQWGMPMDLRRSLAEPPGVVIYKVIGFRRVRKGDEVSLLQGVAVCEECGNVVAWNSAYPDLLEDLHGLSGGKVDGPLAYEPV